MSGARSASGIAGDGGEDPTGVFEDGLHAPEATAGEDCFLMTVRARDGAIDNGLGEGVVGVRSAVQCSREQSR